MTTLQTVHELILKEESGADVSKIIQKGNNISGVIRAEVFEGKNSHRRKQWVDRVIRSPLGAEGINVGVIVCLTPEEILWGTIAA